MIHFSPLCCRISYLMLSRSETRGNVARRPSYQCRIATHVPYRLLNNNAIQHGSTQLCVKTISFHIYLEFHFDNRTCCTVSPSLSHPCLFSKNVLKTHPRTHPTGSESHYHQSLFVSHTGSGCYPQRQFSRNCGPQDPPCYQIAQTRSPLIKKF